VRIPAKIYRKKQAHDLSRDNLVYQFEDLVNTLPHRLTPRDDLSYQESKAYFADSQMILSAGEWTVHSVMDIDSNNGIYITGSGYHTILNCGTRNTTGIMVVNGNDVVIENIKFSRTTDSAIPDVGSLLHVRGQRVVIRNCWFDASNALNAITAAVADNLTIESCVFDGGRGDIIYLLDSDNLVVSNNRITPAAGWGLNAINFASTAVGVPAQRCNEGIILGNHVGGVYDIRYNALGTHRVTGNNFNANLVAYV
jgi:hypothetical protein